MPKVPLYQPRVESRPLGTPYSKVNPDTGAAQIGQGMEVLGRGVQQASAEAQKEKDNADRIAVQMAEVEYEKHANRELYSADGGLLTKQGVNAINGSGQVYDSLTKRRADLLNNLTPRQREMFNLSSQKSTIGYQRQIENHVSSAIRTIDDETIKAKQGTAIDAISANYMDPNERENKRSTYEMELVQWAGRKGMNEAGTKQLVAQWNQMAAGTVLDRFLDTKDGAVPNIEAAKAYFEEVNKKGLLGAKAGHYEAKINEMDKVITIESTAVREVANATPAGYMWPKPDRIQEVIDRIPANARWRKETVERIKAIAAEKEHQREEQGKRVLGRAIAIFDTNGHNINDPRLAEIKAEMFDNNNNWEQLWDNLEYRERALKATTDAEARRIQAEIDAEAKARFRRQPNAAKVRTNIDGEFPKASKTAREEMKGDQGEAQKAFDKGDSVSEDDFRKALKENLDPIYKTGDKTRGVIEGEGEKFLLQFKKEHSGKYPNIDEVNEFIGKRILRYNPEWYKGERRGHQLTDEERKTRTEYPPEQQPPAAKAYIERRAKGGLLRARIPDADRDIIRAKFLEEGRTPTEEDIEAVYNKSRAQKQKGAK